MDYEKKYKNALEWARQVMNGETGFIRKEVEEVFPELRESEDEKSKKWILEYLYDGLRKSDEQFKGQFKAAIAWLEKQGQPTMPTKLTQPTQPEEDERIRKELIHFFTFGKEYLSMCSVSKEDILAWLEKQGEKSIDVLDEEEREFADNIDSFRKEIDDSYQKGYNEGVRVTLEKQCEQKPNEVRTTGYWNVQDIEVGPKFKIGQTIRKENFNSGFTIIKIEDGFYYNNTGDYFPFTDQDNWELVEKNHDDKVEPKFDVGDRIQHSKDCGTIMTIEKIENGEYIFSNNMGHTTIESGNKWYLVEQNNDDKFEPKFKIGDWVVSNLDGKTRQISEVYFDEYNNYYIVEGNEYNIEEYDRLHHLWSINDAKNGDVLVCKDDGYNSYILFGSFNGKNIHCWYNGQTEHFYPGTSCKLKKDATIHPATKEQRDTLMKAIADAGYTFDFEKKELKKISQRMISAEAKEALYDKSAWSEEDERFLNVSINILNSSKVYTKSPDKYEDTINWLKHFKDRVLPQPKQEWSEEDERTIKRIYSLLHAINESDFEDIHAWLKSLKDRVQPKQEWSEEDKQYFNFLEKLLICLQAKSTEGEIKKGTNSNSEYYYKVIQWLKSLRPQNRWKPSDGQMASITCAVRKMKESACYDSELVSLFNDLKKLKGEGL